MFGRYSDDFSYSDSRTAIRLERSGKIQRYARTGPGGTVEKILPPGEGDVVINPVEPVNLPLPLSRYLEIAFPPLVISPGSRRQVFLTFPLEIGVFFTTKGSIHVLDLFSLMPAKFSLYGSPAAGQITRWYRSSIFSEIPPTERFSTGVLDLTINNMTEGTIEVSRTILDSDSMHLFYDDHVSMTAFMEIYSTAIARTSVKETPPRAGMTHCVELYLARRIPPVHGKGHLMEYGVA